MRTTGKAALGAAWVSFTLALGAIGVAPARAWPSRAGAAKPGDETPVTRCELPEDQKKSLLSGHFPLPGALRVFFDARLSSEQLRRVKAAIEAWNRFARASLGGAIFEIAGEDAERPALIATGDPTQIGPAEEMWDSSVYVALYTTDHLGEKYAFDPNVLGGWTQRATLRLGDQRSVRALVLLNDKDLEPLESVATHELGHALGLDHSCDAAPKQGADPNPEWVACKALKAGHPYLTAVMSGLPFMTRGPGSSRPINDNDRMRAYCALGHFQ